MKKLKVLLFAALIGSIYSQSFAFAGQEGGGGAGICKDGKCITLAQAGFRIIEQEKSQPFISAATLKELDKIEMAMKRIFRTKDVIGNPDDIVFVTVTDSGATEGFIKTYQDLLISQGQTDLRKNVELLGFTTSRTTYLIKESYESLEARGQALLLIHEFLIRTHEASVTQAVKFDGELLDYLTRLERGESGSNLSLLRSLRDLRFNVRNYLLGEVMAQSSLTDSDILTLDLPMIDGRLNLDFRKVLDLNDLIPGLAKDIGPDDYVVDVKMNRGRILYDFYYTINKQIERNKLKVLKVTNRDFQNYLKKIDPSLMNVLETCQNVLDSKVKFYKNSTPEISLFSGVSCKVDLSNGNSDFVVGMAKDFQGMSIGNEYSCKPKKFPSGQKFVVCE